ncbi:MAG: putative Rossmann fold enzyme, partial [Patiriisocius sp.]
MLVKIKYIWDSGFQTFTSLFRVIFQSKKFIRYSKGKSSTSNDVVILGNGPSLNEFVESSEDFLATRSKLAVNYFVRSEFYQRL